MSKILSKGLANRTWKCFERIGQCDNVGFISETKYNLPSDYSPASSIPQINGMKNKVTLYQKNLKRILLYLQALLIIAV